MSVFTFHKDTAKFCVRFSFLGLKYPKSKSWCKNGQISKSFNKFAIRVLLTQNCRLHVKYSCSFIKHSLVITILGKSLFNLPHRFAIQIRDRTHQSRVVTTFILWTTPKTGRCVPDIITMLSDITETFSLSNLLRTCCLPCANHLTYQDIKKCFLTSPILYFWPPLL